jgi:two-component system, LytTR family, response regulator
MSKIKAIIIDDELRARNLLNGMLQEFCPDIVVLDLCPDLPNGVKAIHKNQPDIVFLDIEMPGHSGLELLDFFNPEEISFSIIFTTAYSEYAIKAFKLSALDYLLKPIEPNDLEEVISRYKKIKTVEQSEFIAQINHFKNRDTQQIGIPTLQGFKFINIDNIVFIKADNTYTELTTKDHEKIVISRTLKNFEDVLSDFSNFQRAHKSYIVNSNFVTDYIKSDGGYLIVHHKYHVPVSNEKVEAILKHKIFIKR